MEFESIEVREQPPTIEELTVSFGVLGAVKKMYNTSGVEYRKLELKDKLPSMSDAEAIQLLSENGALVKRPLLLIDGGKKVVVGFREAEWEAALA